MKQTLTVQEAIESRHSIRTFVQEPIPKEDITQIFELVRLSPSAWNLQPWRFHVITDNELKEKLEAVAYGQKQVTSAPAVIIVESNMEDTLENLPETVHPGLSPEQKEDSVTNLTGIFEGMSVEERAQWALAQTNIALGFLLISIQGLGYSSVPMLGFEADKVKELLNIPAHSKLAAMVPFGRPAGEGHPHHRFALDKIVNYK
ncbi:nitroreductase family protein [Bacillus sp. FJAT-45350]|uniref:nitroreductase family protein n=1 Tax=Bacillus sp. FJAT-45350 TaxID=2011014 RepID=UPI00211CF6CB|nr:nitroreductase family protein [Bacillus sp. FJAT-45350]